jgi:hypothetical protein
VWANARTAYPDAFTGSGAPNQDRGAIIFPERTFACPEDAVLAGTITSHPPSYLNYTINVLFDLVIS